jgi:predicted Holliday junction resolvase-like endonuclease
MWTLFFILLAVLLFLIVMYRVTIKKIKRQLSSDYNRLAAAERKLYKDVGNAARIRNLNRK